jgi:hypothetical protein
MKNLLRGLKPEQAAELGAELGAAEERARILSEDIEALYQLWQAAEADAAVARDEAARAIIALRDVELKHACSPGERQAAHDLAAVRLGAAAGMITKAKAAELAAQIEQSRVDALLGAAALMPAGSRAIQ